MLSKEVSSYSTGFNKGQTKCQESEGLQDHTKVDRLSYIAVYIHCFKAKYFSIIIKLEGEIYL